MEIPLDCHALGIPTEGLDATEMALEIMDRGPLILLLEAGRAYNVTLHADTQFASDVLIELGLRSTNGDRNGRPYNEEALRKLYSDLTWVVSPPGLKDIARGKNAPQRVIVAYAPPGDPGLFKHLVVLLYNEDCTQLVIWMDGSAAGAFPSKSNRVIPELQKRLREIADSAPGTTPHRSGPLILIPDTSKGTTTLQAEIAWAKGVIEARMAGYKEPDGSSTEAMVLKTLLLHSDGSVKVDGTAQANLRNIIAASVRVGKPIPISIALAHGIRVPHPLKNRDPFGPPTAAWLYNIFEFTMINAEICRFYQPGIQIFVLEEGTLFWEMLGVPQAVVARNLKMVEVLASKMDAPVVSIPLLPEQFPPAQVAQIAYTPTDEEVYAFLCSDPDMTDPTVMDPLYQVRNKDLNEIRRKAGRLWQNAATRTSLKSRIMALRKRTGLFQRLISEHLGESVEHRVVDAAATEKEGRVCFKLTAWAMFNHGAAVLDRDDHSRAVCSVVPEYRLASNTWRAPGSKSTLKLRPVKISPLDFGVEGEPYTWCYEVVS